MACELEQIIVIIGLIQTAIVDESDATNIDKTSNVIFLIYNKQKDIFSLQIKSQG